MNLFNGILNLASRCRGKWFSKSFISLVTACWFFVTGTAVYAEKKCIDAGYGIPDAKDILGSNTDELGILQENIDFKLADIGFLFDVNVELNISGVQMGDLTARISSPNTTQITLFERSGTADAEGDPFTSLASLGCGGRGIDAIFDDGSSNPRIENEPCTTANLPYSNGDYIPHDPKPNNFSAFNDENPIGDWAIYISDTLSNGTAEFEGTLIEACVDIQYAGVTFDKWVSTNATCSDTLDDLTVSAGTPVFYCYTVSNPSTELFTINPGDTSDNQGHNISGLEGTYAAGSSNTVTVGPLTTGTDIPLGVTINIAEITATFATLNFTGPLITDETARLNVPPPVIEISKTAEVISDPVNTTNPKAIPGAIVEYTILVTNSGLGSTDIDTIIINDPIPENTRLFFGTPTNPVAFSDGTIPPLTSSGLIFNFATLASTTDDIAFSNDGGVSTVTPDLPDADGFDATTPPINHISINPKGIFNSSNGTDTPSFEIKFRVRVE